MFEILDVGSGVDFKGSVNCDIDLKCKGATNFVRCDGRFLPFKDKSFNMVYCSHLVEHMKGVDVYKLLDEVIRVARHKVTIKVPHRLSWTGKLGVHHSYFDVKWWDHWIKKNDFTGKICVIVARIGKFLRVFPLPSFDLVITVIVKK